MRSRRIKLAALRPVKRRLAVLSRIQKVHSSDVIVVGGGLMGMLVARGLALEGLRTVLLERQRVGQESSWAAAGVLSPLPPWECTHAVSDLVCQSQKRYPALTQTLTEETGIDPEWIQSGLLVLPGADADQGRAVAWGNTQDVAVHKLMGTEIEPALCPDIEKCLWLPSIAQLRPPRLLRALRQSIDRYGVRICEGEAVVRLLGVEEGRIQGVETRQRSHYAHTVIVSAGAWSGTLVEQWLPPGLSIKPIRGQMILFAPGPARLSAVILTGHDYLVPRRDGRILAGSTHEQVGFDKTCTEFARKSLYAMAINLLPRLADAGIEAQWSGLRPGATSEIPLMGPIPQVQGLYLCAGHHRHGVAAAPASAQLMCDLVLGHAPQLDADAYAPCGISP
jgi:glycine oxidase